jgi:hypothetical protein
MNQTVKVHRRLVDFQEVFVVKILRVRALSGEDHLHSFVEVLKLLSEAVKVEIVADVLLIDLNEKLVALEVAEPADPTGS